MAMVVGTNSLDDAAGREQEGEAVLHGALDGILLFEKIHIFIVNVGVVIDDQPALLVGDLNDGETARAAPRTFDVLLVSWFTFAFTGISVPAFAVEDGDTAV